VNDRSGCASARLLDAYAAGSPAIAPDREWALEAHLETCPDCRERLAAAFTAGRPERVEALDAVWAAVDAAVDAGEGAARAPVRSRVARWLLTWASPAMGPWPAMTVLVVLAALLLDVSAWSGHVALPSPVLLIAPVAPLLGVAAAWARPLDPMHELIASAPRAGLRLVLQRTAAVLAVVIPVVAVAGLVAGVSPVLWLLPCLAFTLGALALGTAVGVGRAASALAACWAVAVLLAGWGSTAPPVVLEPASLPWWGLAAAVAAVAVRLRAAAYLVVRCRN